MAQSSILENCKIGKVNIEGKENKQKVSVICIRKLNIINFKINMTPL